MLFIQALEKVQAKPIEHIKNPKRINVACRKENTDTVDLSSSSSSVLKINKSSTPESDILMNIEATLLQQALLHLSQLPIPIYQVQDLGLRSNEWEIELQKPPRTSPSRVNQFTTSYSNTVKHSPTEIINYSFSMEIQSTDGRKHHFYMDIRTARFTQKNNNWPQESIEQIHLLPTMSNYDHDTLFAIDKQFTFFFDQDGNENQAQPILEVMKIAPKSTLLKNNNFFQGMRIWRNDKERLDIALIGDPYIGAIHTATLKALVQSH